MSIISFISSRSVAYRLTQIYLLMMIIFVITIFDSLINDHYDSDESFFSAIRSTQSDEIRANEVVDNNQIVANKQIIVKDNNERDLLDPLNCAQFLEDYRVGNVKISFQKAINGTIENVEMEHKMWTRLSITKHPFWASLHSETVDVLRWCIFTHGKYYESKLSDLIEKLLGQETDFEKRIFLDIGGNIGWFSLLAASFNAQVYTFEPNHVNIIRYCQSLQLNNWLNPSMKDGPYVEVYDKGLSDEHGEELVMRSYTNQFNPGSFSFHPRYKRKGTELSKARGLEQGSFQLITLDKWAESKGWFDKKVSITFMKLDVEGLEYKVIRGAHKMLFAKMIKNIVMEFKGNKEDRHERMEILETLTKAGFQLIQHGRFIGPHKALPKKYTDMNELLNDVDSGRLGENLWLQMK